MPTFSPAGNPAMAAHGVVAARAQGRFHLRARVARSGDLDDDLAAEAQDVAVRMISMERAHRAVPLTGAMCLGVAARIPGTVAHRLARPVAGDEVRVANPSGVLSVGAVVEGGEARSAVVFRTARRLMQGAVLVP